MSAREKEALVCRFPNEAYSKGNLTIGHDLLTDNCVFHAPGSDIEGAQGWECFAAGVLSGLPEDLQIAIGDTVAKGNKVAVRWAARGTQAGPLRGIGPTNRQMQWRRIAIYYLSNGRLRQAWGGNHPLCMM